MQISDRDLGTVKMVVHNLLSALNWRLSCSQSQSGYYGEENNLVCKYTFGVSFSSLLVSTFFVIFPSRKMPIDNVGNILM